MADRTARQELTRIESVPRSLPAQRRTGKDIALAPIGSTQNEVGYVCRFKKPPG